MQLTKLQIRLAAGLAVIDFSQCCQTAKLKSPPNISCANHTKGSKLWQLSTYTVVAFHKYIQVFISGWTGRAYMGEVLTGVGQECFIWKKRSTHTFTKCWVILWTCTFLEAAMVSCVFDYFVLHLLSCLLPSLVYSLDYISYHFPTANYYPVNFNCDG